MDYSKDKLELSGQHKKLFSSHLFKDVFNSVGQISLFWTNEYPNILVIIDIQPMNIWKFLAGYKDNEWISE